MESPPSAEAPLPSPPLGWVRSQPEKQQLVPLLPLPPAAPQGQQRTVVLSWGSNTAGQLGLYVLAPSNSHSSQPHFANPQFMRTRGSGDFLTRVMPAPVDSLAQTTVLALVCGSRTTLALDKEGRVFAWGKGDDGQLGIGERGTVVKPRLVTALLRHPIAQLACRGAHVLALDASGQVWAWGRNDDGQLGVSRGAGDDREPTARPQRVQAREGKHRHSASLAQPMARGPWPRGLKHTAPWLSPPAGARRPQRHRDRLRPHPLSRAHD